MAAVGYPSRGKRDVGAVNDARVLRHDARIGRAGLLRRYAGAWNGDRKPLYVCTQRTQQARGNRVVIAASDTPIRRASR